MPFNVTLKSKEATVLIYTLHNTNEIYTNHLSNQVIHMKSYTKQMFGLTAVQLL